MAITHARTYEFIFSLATQKTIRDTLPAGNLNKQRSIRTFAPLMEDQPGVVSDQAWYGKGHTHPTFRDVIQKMYTLPSQDRSATSLEALFAVAMVLGDAEHTQVDATRNVGAHEQWVCTWRNLQKYNEVRYTTMLEKMGTEYHRLLSGAYISEVTLTGNRDDHVMMNFTGGAARYFPVKTDSADTVGADQGAAADTVREPITSPGITEASFYKTLFGTVRFAKRGSSGDNALGTKLTGVAEGSDRTDPITGVPGKENDVSAQVLSWTFTFTQTAQPYFLMGNEAGQEDRLSTVLIGDQIVSGSVVIFVSKEYRQFFLDQDTVALELVCKSPDRIGDATIDPQHEMRILVPALKVSGETFGEDGDQVSYTLTFDQESVLKTNEDDHVRVTFITDIDEGALLKSPPTFTPKSFAASDGSRSSALSWTAATSSEQMEFTKYQYRYKLGTADFGPWVDVSGGAAATAPGSAVTFSAAGTATFELRAVNGDVYGEAVSDTATIS